MDEARLQTGKNAPARRGRWTWRNAQQVTNPGSPKIEEAARIGLQARGCAVIYFCENVAVHAWLKQELIRRGVPAERIAVLNAETAPTPQHRQTIAEKFNGISPVLDAAGRVVQEGTPPEFDYVIANSVAYEGIDLQVRTCQVIHLDLPWEPATLQQRNGRAVRQGNTQSVIGITYLLSDRSLDAVRLSMITGKLNWMKDVLESAERETNNPAAQSELSGEEMVLFLARDPEEAKAAIEAQKALLEEEKFKRVRAQAWTALRGLASRTSVMARIVDAAEKKALEGEVAALVDRVRQIPTMVWPWSFLVPHVQAGRQMLWNSTGGEEWVLLEDSFVVPGADGAQAFATGRVIGDSHIGVRSFGGTTFKKYSREQIQTTFGQLSAESVEQGPSRWNREEDEKGASAALEAALQLPSGSWADVDPGPAPESWRDLLIERWWARILAAVRQLGAALEFDVPVNSGSTLKLVKAAELTETDLAAVMPFSIEHWKTFVTAATEAGIRFSDLNETSLGWWGRPFPRGILRQKTDYAEITVMSSDGPVSVKPLRVEGSLALNISINQGHDDPDGVRYTVTHIPSGRAVISGLKSEQAGEAALRYVNAQPIDWSAQHPEFSKLPGNFRATLLFIRDSAEVPTDAQIRKFGL